MRGPRSRKQARIGASRRCRDVTMEQVFDWVQSDEPCDERPKVPPSLLAPLVAFFGTSVVGALEQQEADQYRAQRTGMVSPATKQNYSDATVTAELQFLAQMIRNYGKAHRTPLQPNFHSGTVRRNRVHRVLKRDEIHRLLRAAYGWKWNATSQRMERSRTPGGRRKQRFWYTHVVRYVLLALMTGCSERCVRQLRWSGDPNGAASYIDVKNGLLYRLGDEAPVFAKFAGHPVIIPEWLMPFVRRWHAVDAKAGFDRVIHDSKGEEVKSSLSAALRNLTGSCGLKDLSPTTLVDTCAAEALSRGASLYGVAMMLGLGPIAVRKRYDHFRHDYQADVELALENPLESKPRESGRTQKGTRPAPAGQIIMPAARRGKARPVGEPDASRGW